MPFLPHSISLDLSKPKKWARMSFLISYKVNVIRKVPKLDGQARFISKAMGRVPSPFPFLNKCPPLLRSTQGQIRHLVPGRTFPDQSPTTASGLVFPEDLLALLSQDILTAQKKLASEPMDYLGLRDYQEKAIHKIEAALDQGLKPASHCHGYRNRQNPGCHSDSSIVSSRLSVFGESCL